MGTSRRPARRRRLLVGAALTVVVAVWAGLVLRDALGARAALEDARASVNAARTALSDADLAEARREVQHAREAANRAVRHTGNAVFRSSTRLPLAGRSPAVVRSVALSADAAVRVLEAAVTRAGGLLTEDGRLALPLRQEADGSIDVAALQQVADAMEGLPLDALDGAAARLRSSPDTWIPGAVADARTDAIELVDDALGTVERARTAVEVLPSFLGGEGRREYFLAMQNPSELRGTGGLIGFYAVLTVDGGRFSLSDPTPYNALALDSEGGRSDARADASEEFLSRYGHVAAERFFANINVDPDLPTTAEVILDLYAERRGAALDGLVAMDPVALGHLMRAIGPVPIPADALGDSGSGAIPDPVPAERIADVTMIEAYDVFGGPERDRKEFLAAFAEAVFTEVFTSSWDAVDVGRGLGTAASDRHLQLYSVDRDEQAAFVRLGVAGRMPTVGTEGDVLGVSANNAAGNKQDVHVAHRLGVDVVFSEVVGRRVQRNAAVEVTVENPLGTTGHDIYIVGAHPPDVTSQGPEAHWSSPRGLNRTWFTVWAPESSDLAGAVASDGEPLSLVTGRIHGHLAADHFLETPSRSTGSFEADLTGPVTLRRMGADLVYDLTLWHQSKAIPDHWDVRVDAPPGWDVASVTVAGGGTGAGMGVGGEKVPLTAEVTGDATAATLTGTAMADVQLEVRFTRGLWSRFRAWLDQPLL